MQNRGRSDRKTQIVSKESIDVRNGTEFGDGIEETRNRRGNSNRGSTYVGYRGAGTTDVGISENQSTNGARSVSQTRRTSSGIDYDTKKTEFYVNDFDNYYQSQMGEELSHKIVRTIPIDGNEEYIKSLERSLKNGINANRSNIALHNANLENSKGHDNSIDVNAQRQRRWAEYFDELLEKFRSEGIDRGSYYTESGRNNSIAPPIKTPNNGVFFDDKT